MWIPLIAAAMLTGYVFVARTDIRNESLAKLKAYALTIDDFDFLKQECWKLKAWNKDLYMELLRDHDLAEHMRKLKERKDLGETVRVSQGGAATGAAPGGARPGPGPMPGRTGLYVPSLLNDYAKERAGVLTLLKQIPEDVSSISEDSALALKLMTYMIGLRNDLTEAENTGGLARYQEENLEQFLDDIEAANREYLVAEMADGLIASFPSCMDSAPELKGRLSAYAGDESDETEFEQEIDDLLDEDEDEGEDTALEPFIGPEDDEDDEDDEDEEL